MKVLVAAEDSGCVKEVCFPQGTDTSVQTAPQPDSIQNWVEQGRTAYVEKMDVNNNHIALARHNGSIEVYTKSDFELEHKWQCWESNDDTASTNNKGKHFVAVILERKSNHVTVCDSEGLISRFVLPKNKDGSAENKRDGNSPTQIQFKTQKTVSMFKQSPFDPEVFAIGGKELDLEIIKLSDGSSYESQFKGKNVKNDRLDMPVPVWVVDMVFVSPEKYVTATHYGQLRVYDKSKGRRPQHDVKVTEKPITSLVHDSKSGSVIYSDNHSTVAAYSIDDSRSLGKFHGATGAVQDLHIHKSGLLASGGLDRYLRVFDSKTHEIRGKVFVGTQITCVWILDEKDAKRKTEEEEEEDELWDQLSTTKKRKIGGK